MRLLLGILLALTAASAWAQPASVAQPPVTPITAPPSPPVISQGALILPIGATGSAAPVASLNITRAQIPATTIGANKTVQLNGYRAANDLGLGAIYTSTNCTSTGLEEIADAGGTPFCLVLNGHANIGWFGAKASGSTITGADITANPQWRGCYASGTSWDAVALQEAVYAALAANSTPAAGGCTPPTAPASLSNITWNAVSSAFNLNSEIDVPPGTFHISQPVTFVGSHFKYEGGQKGSSTLAGPANGTIIYCDSCSYSDWHNLTLLNTTGQSYGSQLPEMIQDYDGTYAVLKTQQNTYYDLFCNVGLNGECVSISPSGSAAQGDTQTFINPIFAGALSDYAIKLNGSNTLQTTVLGGDCQGFTRSCVQNNFGSFAAYDFHQENQNVNLQGVIFPFETQITKGGADFLTTGGVSTVNCSGIHDIRSEGDVLSQAAAGSCNDVTASDLVGVDYGTWPTSSNFPPRGSMVIGNTGANTSTRIFLLVNTGGQDNFSFPTSITANTLTDNTQTWTVNQWAGFRLLFRFGSTGFASACQIASNTATVITLTTNCLSPPAAATSMYAIQGTTGGTAPNWASVAQGFNTLNAGAGQGFSTLAASNQVGVSGIVFAAISVNDWVMIPNASNVIPGGTAPTFVQPLYAQVSSKSASPCGGGQAGNSCLTLTQTAAYTLSNTLGYYGTGITDNNDTWIDLNIDGIAGANWIDDFTSSSFTRIGLNIGNITHSRANRPDWLDVNGGQGALQGPGAAWIDFDNDARIGCVVPLGLAPTVSVATPSQTCNTLTLVPNQAITLTALAAVVGEGQSLHLQIGTTGTPETITFGSNFTIPANFSSTWTNRATGVGDFYFQSTGLNGWVEVAGPNTLPLTQAGTPTLTGTCTTNTQTGGNTAGTFKATCTSQTVIITFASNAPTGWACDASDETTPADTLIQTAHAQASCTLTGTTAAADVIVFHAAAF